MEYLFLEGLVRHLKGFELGKNLSEHTVGDARGIRGDFRSTHRMICHAVETRETHSGRREFQVPFKEALLSHLSLIVLCRNSTRRVTLEIAGPHPFSLNHVQPLYQIHRNLQHSYIRGTDRWLKKYTEWLTSQLVNYRGQPDIDEIHSPTTISELFQNHALTSSSSSSSSARMPDRALPPIGRTVATHGVGSRTNTPTVWFGPVAVDVHPPDRSGATSKGYLGQPPLFDPLCLAKGTHHDAVPGM